MPRRRTMTPEGYVKDAVLDLFAAERIFVLRVNSGNLVFERGGRTNVVKLAPEGTADILAIVPCGESFMPLWVETKAGKNGLRPKQADFRDEVVTRGHAFLVARSSDEVLDWLRRFRNLHGR